MIRKAFPALVLSFGLALAAAAQTPSFLKAGGWELGGSCLLTYSPGYALFASDLSSAQKASYRETLDSGIKAGIFLMDRFSLALRGSVFWMYNHDGVSPTESKRTTLSLGLGLEPTYYLMLTRALALGLGGELGIYVNPGVDGLSSGVSFADDSLYFSLQAEPKAGAYFFISGGLAAYAQLGWKFVCFRQVKDSDGNAYTYPSGHTILDDLYGRLHCSIGLTYFLPPGSRAVEEHETSFNDTLDNIGL